MSGSDHPDPDRPGPDRASTVAALVASLAGRRCVLLGDSNVDVVLDVPALPEPGGDALASTQTVGLGGSAANTAVLLQRLGATTTMLSAVGRDTWGTVATTALAAAGVGVEHVVTVADAATSLNVVAVTPDGERTMLACRGASSHYPPDRVPAEVVAGADLLHVSGYALLAEPQASAAMRAVELAAAAGVPVSLDLPVGPAEHRRDAVLRLLQTTSLLMVGQADAGRLTGATDPESQLASLHRLGVGTVALTLGADGAHLSRDDTRVRIAGVPVPVVDTTGAGDAFSAGMVAGLLAGLPLAEAGRLANLCGAAAVQRRGAGTSMPTMADIEEVMGTTSGPR